MRTIKYIVISYRSNVHRQAVNRHDNSNRTYRGCKTLFINEPRDHLPRVDGSLHVQMLSVHMFNVHLFADLPVEEALPVHSVRTKHITIRIYTHYFKHYERICYSGRLRRSGSRTQMFFGRQRNHAVHELFDFRGPPVGFWFLLFFFFFGSVPKYSKGSESGTGSFCSGSSHCHEHA